MNNRQQIVSRMGLLSASALVIAAGCSSTRNESTSSVQMNQFTSSQQSNVAVAVDDQDRILVAWDSRRQQGGRYGVYGRWADMSGGSIGEEFAINEHVDGHQKKPSLAADSHGGFWIAWTSTSQDGHGSGIVARRFSDDQWQPEIAINEHRSGHQEQPSIAINDGGQALVTWLTQTPDGYKVALRGLGTDGRPLAEEVHLESPETAALPRVVALPDENFAVIWQIASDIPEGLVMQVVEPDGRVAGPLRKLAGNGSIEASVDRLSDGAIVAWLAPGDEHYTIFVQRLDAIGAPRGAPLELVATRETDAWISGAHVASGPDDDWTIVWNEDGSGKGNHRVRLQEFNSLGIPVNAPRWLDELLDPGHHVAIAASTPALIESSSGRRVIGFSGKGTGVDSSAANLMVIDPVVVETQIMPVPQGPSIRLAMNPNPPIFDPDFMPLDPMPRRVGAGVREFEGISATGWTPPDPDIAVGPNHVVQVVNGGIAAYTFDGTQLFQTPIEGGGGFWGTVGAPGFVFDPEVIWDPHARRFIAMANARDGSNSYFLLAVSATEQADGQWYKYLLDVSNFDADIDSPNLSVDDSFIYLSADFFSPDKYLILCVKKDPALVGDPLTWKQLSLSGSGNQSLGMPVTWDAGEPQYLLQSSEGTGNGVGFNEIRIHAIANPDLDPTLQTYDLPVEPYSYPAQPPQQGTTQRPYLFEPRFWSCLQRGGSIWAVHHVNNDRARVRWYQINMNGWPDAFNVPSVAQWGEIDAGLGICTYFPGIAVDGYGNAAITFARSSANEYISMYSAKREAGDPLGTFQPMKLVKQSSAPDTSGRWGDYAGVAPSPDEAGRIWLAHEWTNGGGWRTWIKEVEFPLCIADVNGDNVVNVTDILQVIANYGACPSCIEDMNDDGFVGIYEILTLLDNWGPC